MVNPLLDDSDLDFGMPHFEALRLEHFAPALDEAMARQSTAVERIATDPTPPTFENTIEALEQSGALLDRVTAVFFNQLDSDASPEIDRLDAEYSPRLARHRDSITQHPGLFERIEAVWQARAQLDEEARFLTQRYRTEFMRAGAALDDAAQQRLREINAELAELTSRFDAHLQADTNHLAVEFDDHDELAGLGPGELSTAEAAARERNSAARYVVALPLPTGHPWLSLLERPSTRERIMSASRARGSRPGANDNRPLVRRIAELRAERAGLLGFDDHAAWVTADETAESPARVRELLQRLSAAAARNARMEQSSLETLAGHDIAASDWSWYDEQLRQAEFDFAASELRPYFEADRVLHDGVFFAANQLYGITMHERDDLPAHHADVRVYEVRDHDGARLGLFLYDAYARPSKRGGAWMNELRTGASMLGGDAIVVNTHNIPKPAAGEPTLLTYDEVNTLFHEFGHALHGLLSSARYPKLWGTNVPRDFVEFPSQVNEMWMLWPDVLENYAAHYETGERMPQRLVDKLLAARKHGEGFATSEYLAAALLDQAWHSLKPGQRVDDVAVFEAAALADAGLDNPAVPPRYSSTYFQHVFGGGYDAGYYSYIWSEVLDADTVEWFKENGGLTRENGDHFRRTVLSVGGSKPALEAFREFRGRDAEIEPLLRRRGLE
ncbi:M3 family metallopeptidase [Ruicaihuangia caeni]|uniref:M3 family metallopeptidase n=1 Tax=Ruicaihuangia caeni TaxID=3042517 RepID=A0AAW6T1Z4_9MICO|nr:M3 family metallopeptidase [Klugiella sp. YN-L-19]MDI2097807.1 M3 family metallopeptidase [Klugiella sp. YN-L-19]